MRRFSSWSIVASSCLFAAACGGPEEPGPLVKLGVQWSKTVIHDEIELDDFRAAGGKLYVFSTREMVAYSADGDEVVRKPTPPEILDPSLNSGGVLLLDGEIGLFASTDHELTLRDLDEQLVEESRTSMKFELFVRQVQFLPGESLHLVTVEGDPLDIPDDRYYLKVYNMMDGQSSEGETLEEWMGLSGQFYRIGDVESGTSGDLLACEEVTGSLWQIRPGQGIVNRITFWDDPVDTADSCKLEQTDHGLVTTWVGVDGIYATLFDSSRSEIVRDPRKIADNRPNIPVEYRTVGGDTLIGISDESHAITLSTIEVSEDGLEFGRQYTVPFQGATVSGPAILQVMDDELYLAYRYADAAYQDTIVLAKLDPLPE